MQINTATPPAENRAGEDTARREVLFREIFEAIGRQVAGQRVPDATYRLQFHTGFTFRDARDVLDYLSELGISHCYASPYLKASAGSGHGYDIVDHASLNPELGSEEDFASFVSGLHDRGMGQVLDVVPNHMGVAGNDNAWWLDVLENGSGSPYAAFFDIDWMPLKPDLANKVLLPILGDQFGKVLEDQQLVLAFEEGTFCLHYFHRCFPIAPNTWGLILRHRIDELERELGPENPHLAEYQSIITAIGHLPPRTETGAHCVGERRREKDVIHRRLLDITSSSPQVAAFIAENVRVFNGRRGEPRSFDLLDQLLLEQPYRLAYWRVAADEINYRRFFDVNDMAAIRMENPAVFDQTHALILRLLDQGTLDGLRIDHPDGLYDPADYLRRLQRARFLQLARRALWERAGAAKHGASAEGSSSPGPDATARFGGRESGSPPGADLAPIVSNGERNGSHIEFDSIEADLVRQFDADSQSGSEAPYLRPLYLVVEKILEPGERLPQGWPVQGTTGYDYLNSVNGLFVDRSNARTFAGLYGRFIHQPRVDYKELVYRCSKLIMQASMSSDIAVLGHQLDRISERNRLSRDFTLNSLTEAIREVIACFPVYRTYVTDAGTLERDRRYIELAVWRAQRRNPATNREVFEFLRDILLLQYPDNADDASREDQRRFVGRFQQVTGPVMAKAVEDTASYVYNCLVSLNDVGGDPESFGTTVAAFHQENIDRQANWPLALLATSTHDTKRSEDVRARINVISEIPRVWRQVVFRWSRQNQGKKTIVDAAPAPSRNDEYLLYQTLVGTWPADRAARGGDYVERIVQYMLKAAREAKSNTSWISPNEPYESALRTFVEAILAESARNVFLAEIDSFARAITEFGMWNSLSQTLLKLTCPGIPDIYQGTELWNDSLVDPDNRRPVDYATRTELLRGLKQRVSAEPDRLVDLARELVAGRADGRIKLYLIWRLLNFRRRNPGLCTVGEYVPIETAGMRRDHVCAFARAHEGKAILVAVPRLLARTNWDRGPVLPPDFWGGTTVQLPPNLFAGSLHNLLTGERLEGRSEAGGAALRVSDLLGAFPVAALEWSDPDRASHETP